MFDTIIASDFKSGIPKTFDGSKVSEFKKGGLSRVKIFNTVLEVDSKFLVNNSTYFSNRKKICRNPRRFLIR
ncbi:hypothetical protein AFM12_15900 [Jiulongibacter sediminis]|uniref:Uncharacterized protein n=1 Tax=Jiulongibacter sediminis TaxID=1605367 RepID=A0A0P7BA99_9BACT|nr:hypothetical protein AFM12_15900 [Jiulongibacter sediminis]TBX22836.1 hypothetical protein TK44_15910 [Jiulongibacter sediminis]